jgi:MFS family permease
MEFATSVILNVVLAVVGALLCAGAFALLAKLLRASGPAFGAAFGAFTWSAILGAVAGLIVAFLMQRSNQGFPTVHSIRGRMVSQYAATLLAVVVLNKAKVQTGRAWFAIMLPPAVLFAALLYGTSYPTLTFAQGLEQRFKCVNNLRQIDTAKEMVAEKQGYQAGATIPTEQLSEWLMHGFDGCRCPSGGKYVVNPVGKQAECTVHGNMDDALKPKRKPNN